MALTVGIVRLLDAAVVSDVLALGLLPLEVESGLLVELAAVLVNNALGALDILLSRRLFPPIIQVSCNCRCEHLHFIVQVQGGPTEFYNIKLKYFICC